MSWPTYDLDAKTHALLRYARLLTESPVLIDDAAIQVLRAAGWDERGIYEATALIAFFNFSGRMEAAAGLPPDEIPSHAPVLRTLPVAEEAMAAKSRAVPKTIIKSANQFPRVVLLLNGVTYLAIGLALILAPERFFTSIGNFPHSIGTTMGMSVASCCRCTSGSSTRPGIPHGLWVYLGSRLEAGCFTR